MNETPGKDWHKEVGSISNEKAPERTDFYKERAELKEGLNEDLSQLRLKETPVTKETKYLYGILDNAFGTKAAYKILKVASMENSGFNVDHFDQGDTVAIEKLDINLNLIKRNSEGKIIEQTVIHTFEQPALVNSATQEHEEHEEHDHEHHEDHDHKEEEHEKEAIIVGSLEDQWNALEAGLKTVCAAAGVNLSTRRLLKSRPRLILEANGKKAVIKINRNLTNLFKGNWTDEHCRIYYKHETFHTPVDAVNHVIEELNNTEEKAVAITPPHKVNQHSHSGEDHDGHNH